MAGKVLYLNKGRTPNQNENTPNVLADDARMQLATKVAELAQQYISNQKVCSLGLRFLLYNGLDDMRSRSLNSFDVGLTLAYHTRKGPPELSRDEAMQAVRYAKEVSDLPESVVVAFFAATAANKDLQKHIEATLASIEAGEST